MTNIYVVGIGPGGAEHITPKARQAIISSDIIIGYKVYIDLLRLHFPDKDMRQSGMRSEIERCKEALNLALNGQTVGVVSSGDAGVYGMAGLMHEVAKGQTLNIEVVPGIPAANTSAAVLGAPLMHDYATISLSDLLTPLDLIMRRVELAAQADFVICLYNPKSKGRPHHIEHARQIILQYRDKNTPVGIVRHAGRPQQSRDITTLEKMLDCEINMFATVIIGNSQTKIIGKQMVTPRGYQNKEML